MMMQPFLGGYMSRNQAKNRSLQNAFNHCAEELLRHKSRYYLYAERFLARLANSPGFSLSAYDARSLTPEQRVVLTGLLQERPTAAVGRSIVQVAEAVIQGKEEVDQKLLNKYTRCAKAISPSLSKHTFKQIDKTLDGSISPTGPLLSMASRLGIPIEVKGKDVKVPMRILARHLDSPNATIRQNLQDGIHMLKQGGYRLINDRSRPQRQIDWEQQIRPSAPVVVWRLLMRWTHLQKRNDLGAYSRSA
jgi:hypothetical protein